MKPEPVEHLGFRDHLSELGQVTKVDGVDLVSEVLTDAGHDAPPVSDPVPSLPPNLPAQPWTRVVTVTAFPCHHDVTGKNPVASEAATDNHATYER